MILALLPKFNPLLSKNVIIDMPEGSKNQRKLSYHKRRIFNINHNCSLNGANEAFQSKYFLDFYIEQNPLVSKELPYIHIQIC